VGTQVSPRGANDGVVEFRRAVLETAWEATMDPSRGCQHQILS
jgi:hypothetical protein